MESASGRRYFGWRLIREYAKIPLVRIQLERALSYEAPNELPILDGQGLAMSAARDRLYAVDMNQGRILQFSPRTGQGRVLIPRPSDPRLVAPISVALTPEGHLLVLQRTDGQILEFDDTGHLLQAWPSKFPGALEIASDSAGSLYVADIGTSQARKLDRSGNLIPSWGQGGNVFVPLIVGVAPLPDGSLCASSSSPTSLMCFDAAAHLESEIKTQSSSGLLAVGPKGAIYLSDIEANRIWVLDAHGTVIGRIVGAGYEDDVIGQPRGIVVPGDGRLYAMDGQRVRVGRFMNPEDER